ncbi:MAG: hypothetical protein CMM01_04750 [Rhodopirellula sp.]|nr:hypothetical protein [Rhodopirellula sp.]
MKRILCLLLFFVAIAPPFYQHGGMAQDADTIHVDNIEVTIPNDNENDKTLVDEPSSTEDPEFTADTQALIENLMGPIGTEGVDPEDIATASTWMQTSGITELLGPLTPLALSPFFGVTCLSAISLWGPEWASGSPMLGSNGALRSEAIFITFLVLTILSSVPRFTKVSKPFAQAVDRLEAYAVIIILLTIKISTSIETATDEPAAMVHMGVFNAGLDTFLAIAMIMNILVINSVKFFFEFLAWLTPVPFLDALFELCNKTLCLGLMAIYAFSPTVATIINLAFFVVALIIFRWIYRRTLFYRTMVLDPVFARLWPPHAKPRNQELIVFNRAELGKFAAKSRLCLTRREKETEGWILQESRWWLPQRQHILAPDTKLMIHLGWIMNSVQFSSCGKKCYLTFSRRYSEETLRTLAEHMGIALTDDMVEHDDAERLLEFG